MIEARVPGKLYIAGEYAVVEPGETAVLVAVDRYLTARLTEATGAGRVSSSVYGGTPLTWVRDRDTGRIVHQRAQLDYVVSAIDTVEQLRAGMGVAPRYFDLDIVSELDDASGRKYGLGSSGAVAVAVVQVLDEFYGLGLSLADRCKLALLATIEISPRASGGDLAASTFGGWIRYASPDRASLRAHRAAHGVHATLTSTEAWTGFDVTPLPDPRGLQLLVGWTGSPASTDQLVAEVGSPARAASVQSAAQESPASAGVSGRPPSFIEQSRRCVDSLVASIVDGDPAAALAAVSEARRLLQQLGASSGIVIETPQLHQLCEIAERHDAAAKPSGAGGGDCGIALLPTGTDIEGILREWESNDILRLPLSVTTAFTERFGPAHRTGSESPAAPATRERHD